MLSLGWSVEPWMRYHGRYSCRAATIHRFDTPGRVVHRLWKRCARSLGNPPGGGWAQVFGICDKPNIQRIGTPQHLESLPCDLLDLLGSPYIGSLTAGSF